jgi:DNA-binding transcriptional regulator PaaX
MSPTKQKILLLLLGGLAFGCSYTARNQWNVIKTISKEWDDIDKQDLHKEIVSLYQSKLIKKTKNTDGTYTFMLTDKGKLRALTYDFDTMVIKNKDWDGKWRFVVFDIPEKFRSGRDALRNKIRNLGFYELQKSVFIFPYECENEIAFVIEFFGITKYVRYGSMDMIDNDIYLKKHFKL